MSGIIKKKPLALIGDQSLDVLRSQGKLLFEDDPLIEEKKKHFTMPRPPDVVGEVPYGQEDDDEAAPVLDDPVLDKVFGYDGNEDRSEYLIEVRFGKARRPDYAVAEISLWENTFLSIDTKPNEDPEKRETEQFNVGTMKMFFCGYPDCGHPIHESHVGTFISPQALANAPQNRWKKIMKSHWAICPTCQEKKRNNLGRQITSAEYTGYSIRKNPHDKKKSAQMEKAVLERTNQKWIVDPDTKAKYAVIADVILMATPMQKIAEQVAKIWDMTLGKSDIYMKYHPQSIRQQLVEGYFDHEQPNYDEKEEMAIYPMQNIIKDVGTSGSIVNRFVTFFLS